MFLIKKHVDTKKPPGLKKRIQSPVKHSRLSFLRKAVKYFSKKLYLRSLILFFEYSSGYPKFLIVNINFEL